MSGEPVTIAYYDRTRWGAHDEFVEPVRAQPLADPP